MNRFGIKHKPAAKQVSPENGISIDTKKQKSKHQKIMHRLAQGQSTDPPATEIDPRIFWFVGLADFSYQDCFCITTPLAGMYLANFRYVAKSMYLADFLYLANSLYLASLLYLANFLHLAKSLYLADSCDRGTNWMQIK